MGIQCKHRKFIYDTKASENIAQKPGIVNNTIKNIYRISSDVSTLVIKVAVCMLIISTISS